MDKSDSSPLFSYKHLAEAYDSLFPLEPAAFNFTRGALENSGGRSIIDAGCGTGLLVKALADVGFRAHGFDLDCDLLGLAKSRTTERASFALGDLRNFKPPQDLLPASLVTCYGNTLAHLLDVSEVEQFFRRTAEVLDLKGSFLIQILDYDYLTKQDLFHLPDRQVDGWLFERWYDLQTPERWNFHTRLTASGLVGENSFLLRPWRAAELETLLKRLGFRITDLWGGFDRRPVGDSLPLIIEALKC